MISIWSFLLLHPFSFGANLFRPWPLLVIYRGILVSPQCFCAGGGDPARIHQGVNRSSRLLAGQTALGDFLSLFTFIVGTLLLATFPRIPCNQPVAISDCDQATFPCIVKPCATIGLLDRSFRLYYRRWGHLLYRGSHTLTSFVLGPLRSWVVDLRLESSTWLFSTLRSTRARECWKSDPTLLFGLLLTTVCE